MLKWISTYTNLNDEQLMTLVASGKTAGLKELYNRYNQKLLYYLYRMMGGNEEKAQDLLQEVFLKVIDKSYQFDSSHKFSTWIYTIASNLCKNEYRSKKVREVVENDVDMDRHEWDEKNQEQLLEQNMFEEAIQNELSQMDVERKTTFILRFQENYSISEIAIIQDCSPGTIKSRLHYITRSLAAKLKEFDPNEIEVSNDA